MPRRFAAALLLIPTAAAASPVTLQVDPAQSSITVELCMNFGGAECDSDTSPVAGYAVISLDCLTGPANLTLYDFDFLLTQDIHLSLVFTIFGFPVGTFDATGSDIEIFYANPPDPMPPTALIGDSHAFTYTDVPTDALGTLTYVATGVVCAAIPEPYECNDTIDLSTLGINPVDMQGTIDVNGRVITMMLDLDTFVPLDPDNPDLGGLTITGAVVADGIVPLPDVPTFVGVLLGDITDQDLVCESDLNADGAVSALDIQPYIDALLGP